MHSINILSTYREQAATATSKLEKIVLDLETRVKGITDDETLPIPQRQAKIKAERAAVENAVIQHVKVVQDCAAEVRAQRKFWASTPLVLSMQRFSEIPSSDAQIKGWHSARLSRLPLPQLALEFEHARETNDYPLLALIVAERSGRTGIPPAAIDSKDFDMACVDLPGQRDALAHLDRIEADLKYSEHLFRESRGSKVSAAEKMARGRADPARKRSALEPHAVVTVREDLASTPGSRAVRSLPALER